METKRTFAAATVITNGATSYGIANRAEAVTTALRKQLLKT